MMQKNVSLSIADIGIRINSELDFQLGDRCLSFISEVINPDFIINIYKYEEIDFDQYEKINEQEKFSFYNVLGKIIKVKYNDEDNQNIRWYMHEEMNYISVCNVYVKDVNILSSFSPLYFVNLSEFLIKYNAMIIHSSFIKYEDFGIVFSAPSGTGKSTQAELWKKYYHADILNGDRTVIRLMKDDYMGYGSPYAGSSQIYRNESAKIKAIIVLRQAKHNKLRRLFGKEAFLCILSEMSISQIDKNIIDKQSNWIMSLLKTVPVYLLECLPDYGAVKLVHDELKDVSFGER